MYYIYRTHPAAKITYCRTYFSCRWFSDTTTKTHPFCLLSDPLTRFIASQKQNHKNEKAHKISSFGKSGGRFHSHKHIPIHVHFIPKLLWQTRSAIIDCYKPWCRRIKLDKETKLTTSIKNNNNYKGWGRMVELQEDHLRSWGCLLFRRYQVLAAMQWAFIISFQAFQSHFRWWKHWIHRHRQQVLQIQLLWLVWHPRCFAITSQLALLLLRACLLLLFFISKEVKAWWGHKILQRKC